MAKVIQVGLGHWGFDWTRSVLPTVDSVEVVGYVDTSEEALKRAQDEAGVPAELCFRNLDAAMDSTECDLVLGTLRTEAHYPVAKKVLEAGLSVMVEKPFASNVKQAQELVDIARIQGKTLAVSQNYRYFPAPRKAAEMLAARALGPSDLISLEFRQYAPNVGYRYWDMPDPLLADMSIHHFDLMRMVLGSNPRRLTCRTWNPVGSPFDFDPAGVATIEFENGQTLVYQASWMSGGAPTKWGGEWTMDCAEGDIWWTTRGHYGKGAHDDELIVRRRGEDPETVDLKSLQYMDRAGSLAAVAGVVDGGDIPAYFPSGADNLMSLALVEATILSAKRNGAWVELDEVLQ